MNIETINYISMITARASTALASGRALKLVKADLLMLSTATGTTYVHTDGVDFEEVKEATWQIRDCRTKADFTRRCELLCETMQNMREELATAKRVEWTIKRAANQGLTVTAADVLATSVAQSEIYFNPNHAVDELAATVEAAPKEDKRVEVFAMYATVNDSITVFNEVHQITAVAPTINGTALSYNGMTEEYQAGETILIIENTRPTPAALPRTTDDFYIAAVTRLANRDHGIWLTRAQIEAAMLTGYTGTAEELAASLSAPLKLNAPLTTDNAAERTQARRAAAERVAAATGITVQCAFEHLTGTEFDEAKAIDNVERRQREAAAARGPGRPRKELAATFIKQTEGPGIDRAPVRIFEIHLNNGKHYKFNEQFKTVYLICGNGLREYLKVVRQERIKEAITAGVTRFDTL